MKGPAGPRGNWVWRQRLTLLTAAALALLTTPDTSVGTFQSPATSHWLPRTCYQLAEREI